MLSEASSAAATVTKSAAKEAAVAAMLEEAVGISSSSSANAAGTSGSERRGSSRWAVPGAIACGVSVYYLWKLFERWNPFGDDEDDFPMSEVGSLMSRLDLPSPLLPEDQRRPNYMLDVVSDTTCSIAGTYASNYRRRGARRSGAMGRSSVAVASLADGSGGGINSNPLDISSSQHPHHQLHGGGGAHSMTGRSANPSFAAAASPSSQRYVAPAIPPILILYGSESGTAKGCALMLARELKLRGSAEVEVLDPSTLKYGKFAGWDHYVTMAAGGGHRGEFNRTPSLGGGPITVPSSPSRLNPLQGRGAGAASSVGEREEDASSTTLLPFRPRAVLCDSGDGAEGGEEGEGVESFVNLPEMDGASKHMANTADSSAAVHRRFRSSISITPPPAVDVALPNDSLSQNFGFLSSMPASPVTPSGSGMGGGGGGAGGSAFARGGGAPHALHHSHPSQQPLPQEPPIETFCDGVFNKRAVVIFITATYGEGGPCTNYKGLQEALLAAATAADRSPFASSLLCDTRVAVFGLGSAAYRKFCESGKRTADALERLGARLLVPLVCADSHSTAKRPVDDVFDDWQEALVEAMERLDDTFREENRIGAMQRNYYYHQQQQQQQYYQSNLLPPGAGSPSAPTEAPPPLPFPLPFPSGIPPTAAALGEFLNRPLLFMNRMLSTAAAQLADTAAAMAGGVGVGGDSFFNPTLLGDAGIGIVAATASLPPAAMAMGGMGGGGAAAVVGGMAPLVHHVAPTALAKLRLLDSCACEASAFPSPSSLVAPNAKRPLRCKVLTKRRLVSELTAITQQQQQQQRDKDGVLTGEEEGQGAFSSSVVASSAGLLSGASSRRSSPPPFGATTVSVAGGGGGGIVGSVVSPSPLAVPPPPQPSSSFMGGGAVGSAIPAALAGPAGVPPTATATTVPIIASGFSTAVTQSAAMGELLFMALDVSPSQGLTYQAGDHLSVYPRNDPRTAAAVLELLLYRHLQLPAGEQDQLVTAWFAELGSGGTGGAPPSTAANGHTAAASSAGAAKGGGAFSTLSSIAASVVGGGASVGEPAAASSTLFRNKHIKPSRYYFGSKEGRREVAGMCVAMEAPSLNKARASGVSTFPCRVSLQHVFEWYLDVSGPPKRSLLRTLARCCRDPTERAAFMAAIAASKTSTAAAAAPPMTMAGGAQSGRWGEASSLTQTSLRQQQEQMAGGGGGGAMPSLPPAVPPAAPTAMPPAASPMYGSDQQASSPMPPPMPIKRVYDYLVQYPSCVVPLDLFLEMCPRVQPRRYSIASDGLRHPNEVHVIVKVVPNGLATRYLDRDVEAAPDAASSSSPLLSVGGGCDRRLLAAAGGGGVPSGVTSPSSLVAPSFSSSQPLTGKGRHQSFLPHSGGGAPPTSSSPLIDDSHYVYAFISPSDFHLPSNTKHLKAKASMLMVGPGTGIAPLLGFAHRRLALGLNGGKDKIPPARRAGYRLEAAAVEVAAAAARHGGGGAGGRGRGGGDDAVLSPSSALAPPQSHAQPQPPQCALFVGCRDFNVDCAVRLLFSEDALMRQQLGLMGGGASLLTSPASGPMSLASSPAVYQEECGGGGGGGGDGGAASTNNKAPAATVSLATLPLSSIPPVTLPVRVAISRGTVPSLPATTRAVSAAAVPPDCSSALAADAIPHMWHFGKGEQQQRADRHGDATDDGSATRLSTPPPQQQQQSADGVGVVGVSNASFDFLNRSPSVGPSTAAPTPMRLYLQGGGGVAEGGSVDEVGAAAYYQQQRDTNAAAAGGPSLVADATTASPSTATVTPPIAKANGTAVVSTSTNGANHYVQSLMREEGPYILETFLLNPDGYVYVCGDALRMAKDVRQTFIGLLMRGRGADADESGAVMSREAAEAHLAAMEAQGRYLQDIW